MQTFISRGFCTRSHLYSFFSGQEVKCIDDSASGCIPGHVEDKKQSKLHWTLRKTMSDRGSTITPAVSIIYFGGHRQLKNSHTLTNVIVIVWMVLLLFNNKQPAWEPITWLRGKKFRANGLFVLLYWKGYIMLSKRQTVHDQSVNQTYWQLENNPDL